MKKYFVISLTFFFLLACSLFERSFSPEPSYTPVPPTLTNTPISPTSTATSTPKQPTPTTTPTIIPSPTARVSFEYYDFITIEDEFFEEFNSGYYLIAIGIASEMIETWPNEFPEWYLRRASVYWEIGEFQAAILDLQIAVSIPSIESYEDRDIVYNNYCWYLSLTGAPEEALPYCEMAVEIDPNISYLDSRGLAYALLGRIDEAIADFERVFELAEQEPGETPEWIEERKQWVAYLEAGVDLNTPEFLSELRAKDIVPDAITDSNLLAAENYTREYFSQILQAEDLESEGIIEVNDVLVERFVIETDDGCKRVIEIAGPPEQNYFEMTFYIQDCGEYPDHLAWRLGGILVRLAINGDFGYYDSIELGRAFCWLHSGFYSGIYGDSRSPAKVIYGIEFSSEYLIHPEFGPVYAIYAFRP